MFAISATSNGGVKQAKTRAYRSINAELINNYWQVGGYISLRIAEADWGLLAHLLQCSSIKLTR